MLLSGMLIILHFAAQLQVEHKSSKEASSWRVTVLPSTRLASKDEISSPRIIFFFFFFYLADPSRNVIGIVLSSNWVGFVVKTWQPLHATHGNV